MTVASRPVALTALLLAAAWIGVPAARAQSPAAGADCAAIDDDRERLACHDRASGRAPGPVPAPGSAAPATVAPESPAAPMVGPPLPLLDERAVEARDARRAMGSTLGERWELDPGNKQGRFLLRPYKPTYVLPVHWTDDVNRLPRSPRLGDAAPAEVPLRSLEASFQLSLKSKLLETVGGLNVDLWAGYTQVSHWQVYSTQLSRPFRETNYEPEVFAVWGFDQPMLGWRARMLSLALAHQSNGRSEPLSRSWNRVIVTAGFERGDWSVLLRPWWRLPEDASEDDNPGITDHVGRGEMVVVRKAGAHLLSLQLRHSLKGGDRSRGSVQLDWAFPVSSYLKGHLRVFSGYGETLIDFNHRQTTIGVGVSLAEWL